MHAPNTAGDQTGSPVAPAPAPPEKVVIVLSAGLGPGQAANAAACIAAGLGAGQPGWAAQPLRDAEGLHSSAISHLPIIILSASDAQMAALCDRLPMESPAGGGLALFPAYAQGIHDCHAYWERHRESAHRGLPMLGIGLAGARRWVNGLTGSLPMLR
ncbi:DUF2000 domain-containing protein [Achromobacter sp. Marseille-Q0513]|uniref:DUF2000 domain-containing protein n=1 Tax=Achromobacter sp. Marseille-Q0513 TaxID=2829161 RepID=UPI001B982021|nr:DUF2000 domain-containing protein [Achromobacter sp. Marseille-Q0513]MBR8656527.1 DUF2000 domain-containing protein [Achromobacter sp. Marseille-Q0513]